MALNPILHSQEVPHPVSNTGIYEFLDELAGMQIIEINSAVKPYSRLFIANRLKEADENRDQLNPRQQKELDFYLMDFGKEAKDWRYGVKALRRQGVTASGREGTKIRREGVKALRSEGSEDSISNGKTIQLRRDLFYYKDSLFSLTVNPILGGEIFTNSSGKAYYGRNFGEARAYVQNWGFYASLRDNHEKHLLGRPQYLTKREGGHYKGAPTGARCREALPGRGNGEMPDL